jgi:hypothetical protein
MFLIGKSRRTGSTYVRTHIENMSKLYKRYSRKESIKKIFNI